MSNSSYLNEKLNLFISSLLLSIVTVLVRTIALLFISKTVRSDLNSPIELIDQFLITVIVISTIFLVLIFAIELNGSVNKTTTNFYLCNMAINIFTNLIFITLILVYLIYGALSILYELVSFKVFS